MIETADGITTPSGGDEFKPVQDLAAMAATVQDALERRANMYKGTSSERSQFTGDAEEGHLWKDTNGEKALWAKQGSGWVKVWPEDRSTGVFGIGSRTSDAGTTGQIQLRRYYSATGNNAHANLLMSSNESIGFSVVNWKNSEVTNQFRIWHDGQIEMQTRVGGTRTRPIPFAFASGLVTIPGGAGSATSTSVSFPTGRFTSTPRIMMQYRGAAVTGMNAGYGVSNATPTGFTANMIRSTSTNTAFYWYAVQLLSTDATDPDNPDN